MRIARPLLALALAAPFAGCSRGDVDLYGRYEATGEAQGRTAPAATLDIERPDRYRFCHAGRCEAGRFTLQRLDPGEGRITLHGPAVEAYALTLSTQAYGVSETAKQRGVQGLIDLSYTTGLFGAEISLGPGDTAFRKR